MSRRLPVVHATEAHDAGPYRLEHLDLEFSNGERRRFERMVSRGHGAVVVVPMLDEETVLLERQALHARRIVFTHPASGQRMTVEAPLAPASSEAQWAAAPLENPVGSLEEVGRQLAQRALDQANGNVSAAARQLGISRNTLYRKLGKL